MQPIKPIKTRINIIIVRIILVTSIKLPRMMMMMMLLLMMMIN